MAIKFPVRGKTVEEWELTTKHIADLCRAFPDLDAMTEIRKALEWLKANPRKRKTIRGMPRWLFAWLTRASQGSKVSSWSDQYLDPRWQRKRLKIMERDGFACQECGDGAKTQNVHHRYYVRGNDVWDYPDDALVTLCRDCHIEIEEHLHDLRRIGGQLSRERLHELCLYGISLLATRPEKA